MRTNSASNASCGERLNSSSRRHVSRTASAALSARVGAQLAEPVDVNSGRFRADGDDDEVAVPRLELLELREQFLALRAALRAAYALLRLAGGQLERRDVRFLDRPRLGSALARAPEQRCGCCRRLEPRLAVDGPRLLEQRRASLGRVRVEQPLEPVEPTGGDARERDPTLL